MRTHLPPSLRGTVPTRGAGRGSGYKDTETVCRRLVCGTWRRDGRSKAFPNHEKTESGGGGSGTDRTCLRLFPGAVRIPGDGFRSIAYWWGHVIGSDPGVSLTACCYRAGHRIYHQKGRGDKIQYTD